MDAPAGINTIAASPRKQKRGAIAPSSNREDGAVVAPRVLIVEDDFLVARDLETTLLEAGMDVVGIASAAEEAVELAASERPSLVVMDIRLAGERDGVDAAVEIVRTTGVRCIFATAHQDTETRARARLAKPVGWISKPYNMETAVAAINAALHQLIRRNG